MTDTLAPVAPAAALADTPAGGPKKLYIQTHGCQMNEYDSAKMAEVLGAEEGMVMTENAEEADVILINTCSIREKAQEKVFSQLGRWRGLKGGDAGTFTLLLAAMGSGAIVAVLLLPRLRQAMGRDALVLRGAIVQAAATAVMSVAPTAWVAVPAMFMGGMAWITSANSLSVSAQLSLPNWVRARGMATYQMAIMGASAFGAALWGQVATVSSMRTSLLAASVSGVLLMLLALRYVNDPEDEDDVSPAHEGWAANPPSIKPGEEGRVLVTIEARQIIDSMRLERWLELSVHNTGGNGHAEGAGSGAHIGIGNTRERLRALYGERCSVELSEPPEGGFLARLRIPLREAEPA